MSSRRTKWVYRAKEKLLKFGRGFSLRKRALQSEETLAIPSLNGDVLQQIFENLDLKDRSKMRRISREFRNVIDKIPIRIPFLMIHSDESGHYEILSDQLDFIAGHLLSPFSSHFDHLGDALSMNQETLYQALQIIAMQASSISHLWLDCVDNGYLAKIIVEANLDASKNVMDRLNFEQLTIIGSKDYNDFDWFRKLVLMSRRTLKALRLRHVRITSESQAEAFWQAVAQCHQLDLLQYEPCRTDHFSRKLLIEALQSKDIRNLTVTGIADLSADDLKKINSRGTLQELSVVSDSIKPSVLATPPLQSTIINLKSLLIQIDPWLSLHDSMERCALLTILQTLPRSSILEVVHVMNGEGTPHSLLNSNNHVGRALGYWVGLAMESQRAIKLKLDDVAQDKLDAGVGRVLRKCAEVIRGNWTEDGLWLKSGGGRVLVLDRRTWFGDDDLELASP
ncbi:unnamed protein product, partial [Mesorhabditis belari]|uniref:F-box domain-containing protein n=1 Tax=Mesorhabditis belari TaxID=2138241 RepID=A0AAF3EZQ8_9BILA